MKLVISILIIIMIYCLYYMIDYLYKRYNEDLNNIDNHTVHAQIRINELERKVKMNEKMITWLYDQMVKENLKKEKEKEKKEKKEGKKDE